MPIVIGRPLKAKLPEDQRDGLDEYLWDKSHGTCHLCSEPLNRASDRIEVDHDIPDAEGGPTDRDNLKLAHASCNKTKRDHPSIDMRPYLRLAAFIRHNGGLLKYSGCLPHFGIAPKPVVLSDDGDRVRLELPDGTIEEARVFDETNRAGTFRAAFVELPRLAIWNDEECQPRTIKLRQVGAIYVDLQQNPLHEAPGLRVTEVDGEIRLAMFDGQHKTLSSWMLDRERVVCKLYLNMSPEQANYLVNSVQARIKKLPLSPFELAAKMSDEFSNKFSEYETREGSDKATEKGFIDSLPVAERKRGRTAFAAAILKSAMSDSDAEFLMIKQVAQEHIKEATFTKKLLTPLLHLQPLDMKLEDAAALRTRERETLVRMLNMLAELAFQPAEGGGASEQDKERARRLRYQSALEYTARALRGLVRQVSHGEDDSALFGKELTDEHWARIQEGVVRYVNHPIWTADFETSDKTRRVREALLKNQDARSALGDVGLKVGYLTGADALPNDCLK